MPLILPNRLGGAKAAPQHNVNLRALRANTERRPFWILHYTDRDSVFEGDPCRCRRHQVQDWGCRPDGRVRAIGLYTPDGLYHELGGMFPDMTGLVFQFKLAVRSVEFSGTGFHLIGAVGNTDGGCLCFSWEYDLVSPLGGHLVGPFRDSVHRMAYGNLGPLGLENLGLRL